MESVRFEGIVIGYEEVEGFRWPLLLLRGTVDGRDAEFYLLLDKDAAQRVASMGIGQALKGVGEVERREPLIIRARDVG